MTKIIHSTALPIEISRLQGRRPKIVTIRDGRGRRQKWLYTDLQSDARRSKQDC